MNKHQSSLTDDQRSVMAWAIRQAQDFHDEIGGAIKPYNYEVSNIAAGAIYLRALQTFRSILSCLDGEDASSGFVLSRTLCDITVMLRGISQDPKFAEELNNKSVDERKKRLIGLHNNLEVSKIGYNREELTKYHSEAESARFKGSKSAGPMAAIYDRFKAHELYFGPYAFFSLYTHVDALTLNEYLEQVDGEVQLTVSKNNYESCLMCLNQAMDLLFYCHDYIATILKYEIENVGMILKIREQILIEMIKFLPAEDSQKT